MKKQRTGPSISELFADTELINAAVTRAMREAVLQHARAGNPVCAMQDGQVVWFSPAEVFALLGQQDTEHQSSLVKK